MRGFALFLQSLIEIILLASLSVFVVPFIFVIFVLVYLHFRKRLQGAKMPIQANADNNVPHIGPRSRYSVLSMSPTWVYHEMAGGSSLSGEAPESASAAVGAIDPTVSSGLAKFTSLTKGGLFTLIAHEKRAMVVQSIDNAAGATITIIQSAAPSVSRAAPTAPFVVGPGECIKATGGSAGSKVGVLVRLHRPGDIL